MTASPLADVGTRLAEWLRNRGLGEPGAPVETESIGDGTQNVLYSVRQGAFEGVIRAAPVGSESKASSVRRETRLLRALAGSAVPHAPLVDADEDGTVLGTPFVLMERVDGWAPAVDRWSDEVEASPSRRRQLAESVVDASATMATLDWRAAGLEGFGRPEGFHERQVQRWTTYLDAFRVRDLPGLDDASQWLAAHRPRSWQPGLMHGDFHFNNMMYRDDSTTTVAAILDWEMSTIGDPLLDLGYILIAWPTEGDDMRAGRNLRLDGMPAREEMLARYEAGTGRGTEDIDYYVVLARWKLAIILEGTYARHFRGTWDDPRGPLLGMLAADYMRKAASLAASTTAGVSA